ncbi:MAG TPA: sugar phosphate isomerase/epimerase [Kiritimatiellia bacterium]|nr:sugar phosphate isomerase/epimerase [Kiritimatiellia bacterium]
MKLPANFRRLGGLLEIGGRTAEQLRADCRALRDAGFHEAYLGDPFLAFAPRDAADAVFVESAGALVLRSESELAAVRDIVHAAGLALDGAHYNQVLPPPGEFPCAWLDAYHDAMLDRAEVLGLRRVTTHPGWMFGSAEERCTGDAARVFAAREIDLTELNRRAQLVYGGDAALWRDSVAVYRRLCARAARIDVTVTLETAISEWYDLTLHPERMRAFIGEVGAPNLAICIDSGHCHLNGLNVASVITACGDLLAETHFHDNHGARDEHNPIGDGTIDWPSVIRALADVGYPGSITFEQRNHALNAARWTTILGQMESPSSSSSSRT